MKPIKKLVFLLIIVSIILVTVDICFAQSNSIKIPTTNICFSIEDSKVLVVELEKGRIIEQNNKLLEQSNLELIKQTDLLKEQVKLVEDKFKATESLVSKNEELYNQKIKVINDESNEAKKPRWKSMFVSGGVGALLTLLLIVVL